MHGPWTLTPHCTHVWALGSDSTRYNQVQYAWALNCNPIRHGWALIVTPPGICGPCTVTRPGRCGPCTVTLPGRCGPCDSFRYLWDFDCDFMYITRYVWALKCDPTSIIHIYTAFYSTSHLWAPWIVTLPAMRCLAVEILHFFKINLF